MCLSQKNAPLKLLTSLSNTPTLLFHVLPSFLLWLPFPPPTLSCSFPSFQPPFLFWKKSSRHQSNVVHEPSEVPTILTLAQLPLADPKGSGPAAPPSPRWALPLLYSWIPGQETPRGMRGDGKTTGSPLSLPLFSLLSEHSQCISVFLLLIPYLKAYNLDQRDCGWLSVLHFVIPLSSHLFLTAFLCVRLYFRSLWLSFPSGWLFRQIFELVMNFMRCIVYCLLLCFLNLPLLPAVSLNCSELQNPLQMYSLMHTR